MNKKKLLASGGAGGLFVDDLFSTYLYTGNGSTQTITNGINLADEGGLVWIKSRSSVDNYYIFDTARGVNNYISSSTTSASVTTTTLTDFNSDGFSLSSFGVGVLNREYASWTFRKAPKFFDVVTYTGDGVAGRQIPHSLGTTVGMIIIKRTDSSGNWAVWHRSQANKLGFLDLTNAFETDTGFFNPQPDSNNIYTDFLNANGATYVAYLFAHNDGDGEFGENGDEDIIKCGSFSGSAGGTDVSLGFEAQWVLVKQTDAANDWVLLDMMRGFVVGGNDARLIANGSAAETSSDFGHPLADGFHYTATSGSFVYIAIRRPHKPADSGSEVFAIDTASTGSFEYTAGFPVDMAIRRDIDAVTNNLVGSRLIQGEYLITNSTAAEASASAHQFDSNTEWYDTGSADATRYSWMFKRSKGFFDVVCYTGNGSTTQNVSHNLSTQPELMIVKQRSSTTGWAVYHKDLGNTSYLFLNIDVATQGPSASMWNSVNPNDLTFGVGFNGTTNTSSAAYIAYLFATQAGISKVGSYTGNGTSQSIDCGFSTGARFVLVKRTDSTGDWYIWDTARGIVAGNDPHLSLNTTAAEVTTDDSIDPAGVGFIVNQVAATNINVNSASYIFLAIS